MKTAVDYIKEKLMCNEYWYENMTFDQIIDQAKEMEKGQMKDAFVACWESNVPDGIECKLDAEQYYNETFNKSINDKG